MSVDDVVRLAGAVTALLQIAVWPVTALLTIYILKRPLKAFLENIREFYAKGGGVEVRTKSQSRTYDLLVAASNKKALEVVTKGVNATSLRHAANARILWVDDFPENNDCERKALEAIGVSFVLAHDTGEALEVLQTQNFHAIISDMGRPSSHEAGLMLLNELLEAEVRMPLIIYTTSRATPLRTRALTAGAFGYTNHPAELFQLVMEAIQSARPPVGSGLPTNVNLAMNDQCVPPAQGCLSSPLSSISTS